MAKLLHLLLAFIWCTTGLLCVEAIDSGNVDPVYLWGLFVCGIIAATQLHGLYADIIDEYHL